MKVGEYCNREVVIIRKDESLKAAAELMRKYHVGDVILVNEELEKRIPIGIITDRDLVIEVLALGLEPEKLFSTDIIVEPLCLIQEDKSIFDALELMRDNKIRRLPVVDINGALVGIITIDDITELLTEMVGCIAEVINKQQKKELKRRI